MKKRKNTNHKPQGLAKRYKTGFIKRMDKRVVAYKTLTKLYREIIQDRGGESELSRIQLCLIEEYCFMFCLLKNLQYKVLKHPKKMEAYIGRFVQMVNASNGLAKTIGLERRAKKVLSLKAYAKDKE